MTEPSYPVRRCMVTGRKFVVLCDLQTDDYSLRDFKVILIVRKMGRPHYAICSMYNETIDLYTLDALETMQECDVILKCIEAGNTISEYGPNRLTQYAYQQAHERIKYILTIRRPEYRNRVEEIQFLYKVVKCANAGADAGYFQGYLARLIEDETTSRFYSINARTIQRRFRFAIANPYTLLCKSRLIREFTEMSS